MLSELYRPICEPYLFEPKYLVVSFCFRFSFFELEYRAVSSAFKLNSEPLALYDSEVSSAPRSLSIYFNNNRVRTYNFLNNKQV